MATASKSTTRHRRLHVVIVIISALILAVTIGLSIYIDSWSRSYRAAATAFDLSTVVIPEGPIPFSDAEIERIIAMKDPNFYEHGGWDYWALTRAIVHSKISDQGKPIPGATTITYYVAHGVFPRRGFESYVIPMFLIRHLEDYFTKEEILKLYVELYTEEKLRENLAREDRVLDSNGGKPSVENKAF